MDANQEILDFLNQTMLHLKNFKHIKIAYYFVQIIRIFKLPYFRQKYAKMSKHEKFQILEQ